MNARNDLQNENLKRTGSSPVSSRYADHADNGNAAMVEDDSYGPGNNEEGEDGYADNDERERGLEYQR